MFLLIEKAVKAGAMSLNGLITKAPFADASHCSSKAEKDNIVCKGADERSDSHPDSFENEDKFVAEVISLSSSHQDRDNFSKARMLPGTKTSVHCSPRWAHNRSFYRIVVCPWPPIEKS